MPSHASSAMVSWLILVPASSVWSVRVDCADWEPAASLCFGSWSRSIPAILRTKKRGAWQVAGSHREKDALKKGAQGS